MLTGDAEHLTGNLSPLGKTPTGSLGVVGCDPVYSGHGTTADRSRFRQSSSIDGDLQGPGQPQARPSQCAHAFEAAGRADHRLDPGVRVHQPDPCGSRRRDHRRARPSACGEVDRHGRGADDRARRAQRGPEEGLAPRRQQDRARRRMGPRPLEGGARRAVHARCRHGSHGDRLLDRRARCAARAATTIRTTT